MNNGALIVGFAPLLVSPGELTAVYVQPKPNPVDITLIPRPIPPFLDAPFELTPADIRTEIAFTW